MLKVVKSVSGGTKKLRVGWFSFSCCEDSTIIFTELLNDYWGEWKNKIEIVHALILKKNNELKDLDIAFVEGAITSKMQEDKLLKIRKNSKKLVGIGSCACTGMPSSQRNWFDKEKNAEIQNLLIRFQYTDKVKSLKDIVKVDAEVNGCPMVEQVFLKVINDALNISV